MRSPNMLFASCRRRSHPLLFGKRFNSSNSAHGQLYSDLIPGMVPIALLGSAVYMGLKLAQTSLVHEKYLDEAQAKVSALEVELETLRTHTPIVPEHGGPVLATSSEPNTNSKRWWFF
ncbi:hypothetical protein QCA50_000309 [Cerrena zonata]|uniref:Uncharacterized protein n=1 Tax=Cerrena zonata TaxID=2478898 RepID=A0AAW0GXP4_9APHY